MRVSFLLALCLSLLCSPAHAGLNLFACEPEWAALARLLGGDNLAIYTATTALQDPHHIEARPSLIAQARRADLVICTGADLEAAWLPKVLRESGHAAIQPGQTGYLEAAPLVPRLQIPTRLDRSEGDVHAQGNPHIQTDPRNFLPVAQALSLRLQALDPAHANDYRQQLAQFQQQWRAALTRWQQQGAALKGQPILVQHDGFPYLAAWLELDTVAVLEPKPGMEPGAAHLGQVLQTLHQRPVKMVLRAAYQNARPSAWIAQQAGITAVELPYTVGGSQGAVDLFGLFDDTLARLLAGVK